MLHTLLNIFLHIHSFVMGLKIYGKFCVAISILSLPVPKNVFLECLSVFHMCSLQHKHIDQFWYMGIFQLYLRAFSYIFDNSKFGNSCQKKKKIQNFFSQNRLKQLRLNFAKVYPPMTQTNHVNTQKSVLKLL